jgi:stearoyl-CoA desaturase (delta-9 desaturase)
MRNGAILSQRGAGFNWRFIAFMSFFHAAAVAGLWMFSWSALIVAVALWWVTGSLGIGMGYHRLLTHRGYRTPKWVEYALTVCGVLALQGSPVSWVVTHRLHHANSDREGDLHSPRHGLWWAHVGWMLRGRSPEHNAATTARYAPDITRDRFYVWLTRWHLRLQIALGLALLTLGGWSWVMWGVFVRVVFLWHVTWLVNSAAHAWGSRRFMTREDSRNNWWVALLSFGEGWHNNHHAHPASARHGLAWYEFDLNWYGIRALQLLGLARAVRVAKLPRASVAGVQRTGRVMQPELTAQ